LYIFPAVNEKFKFNQNALLICKAFM